jgi:hypothetical protein
LASLRGCKISFEGSSSSRKLRLLKLCSPPSPPPSPFPTISIDLEIDAPLSRSTFHSIETNLSAQRINHRRNSLRQSCSNGISFSLAPAKNSETHLLRGASIRALALAHERVRAGSRAARCAATSFAAVHRYSFRIDRIDEDGASERGATVRATRCQFPHRAILWEKSRQPGRTSRAVDRPLTSSRCDIHDREAYPWRSDSI